MLVRPLVEVLVQDLLVAGRRLPVDDLGPEQQRLGGALEKEVRVEEGLDRLLEGVHQEVPRVFQENEQVLDDFDVEVLVDGQLVPQEGLDVIEQAGDDVAHAAGDAVVGLVLVGHFQQLHGQRLEAL